MAMWAHREQARITREACSLTIGFTENRSLKLLILSVFCRTGFDTSTLLGYGHHGYEAHTYKGLFKIKGRIHSDKISSRSEKVL